jgi:putative membrane protein insertion efficiency factor
LANEESRSTVRPRTAGRVIDLLLSLPSLFLIGGVRLYQIFLGPFFGGRCRFHPSCSVYFIEAVKKYGAVSGAVRGTWRILRCHPWNPGGFDPP